VKRVAILQSSYIPWRGYFDIIGLVDEFILYDVVQFTKRDWRNRNRIKTPAGAQWLTIPVVTAGAFHQKIANARIADPSWAAKHWRRLTHAYARAPFFAMYRDRFAELYARCEGLGSLSEVNRTLIEAVAADLGLHTRITEAAQYPSDGDRNGRLVTLCRALGATTYVSGPSARAYLDADRFREAGIEIEYMDYSGYRPYPQLHGPFEPSVSVLDLLFNVGPEATKYMRCGRRVTG
jgi:hypothetical protein